MREESTWTRSSWDWICRCRRRPRWRRGRLRPAGQGRSCAPSMPWPRRSATSSPVPHRCRSRSTHRGQLPGGGQGCVRGGAAGAGLGTAVHEQRSGSGAGRRIVDRVAADHRHSGARAVGPDGVWICQSLFPQPRHCPVLAVPVERRSATAVDAAAPAIELAGSPAPVGWPAPVWPVALFTGRRPGAASKPPLVSSAGLRCGAVVGGLALPGSTLGLIGFGPFSRCWRRSTAASWAL